MEKKNKGSSRLTAAVRKYYPVILSPLLTAAAVIIGVETIQFIAMCGACDIDDFILNITGAVMGFGLSRLNIVKRLMFIDVSLKKGE